MAQGHWVGYGQNRTLKGLAANLRPWTLFPKAGHALAFCPPRPWEPQSRCVPSIILPHPHHAQDKVGHGPGLWLFSEAWSDAPQGPGLSCPEQRRQMAPWPSCTCPASQAAWGVQGSLMGAHGPLQATALATPGLERCSRLCAHDPEGPWFCLFPFVPRERVEDVSTHAPPPTLSLHSCSGRFCKASRDSLLSTWRGAPPPPQTPTLMPRRDAGGAVLGFHCGPGWTSHPGVERSLTSLVAPSQCKDASQIPDSPPQPPTMSCSF